MKNTLTTLLTICLLSGCSSITEPFKKIIGNSTEALEEARSEAITLKFECTFDQCYNSILEMARDTSKKNFWYNDVEDRYEDEENENEDESEEEVDDGYFEVFMKNPIKGHIVVMGVKGNVDTTEVGIFLMEHGLDGIQIDVTSLSTSAKIKVAEAIDEELSQKYSKR